VEVTIMAATSNPVHVSTQPDVLSREGRPARSYNVALGYLRAFLVVLVLAHHSVLAYVNMGLPPLRSLDSVPQWWRAFPVVDRSHYWTGWSLFTGFNDGFFMSLMFFVSGLFVWSSLLRKGPALFIRERALRLGIPFLICAAVVSPVAYYPAYLTTGASGLTGFGHQWIALDTWPTGPLWFVSLLLGFDIVAAGLFAIAPGFGGSLSRLASGGRVHPVRFFLLLLTVSATAYMGMGMRFGVMRWTSFGPFTFQTSRLFHYLAYFLMGIGVGAYGIDRGLLATDGTLARHWWRWTALMVAAFTFGVGFFLYVLSLRGHLPPMVEAVLDFNYTLGCAASSFAFMAIFVRFANRQSAVLDSLSANEYGMYLIHYMFVSWIQYAMLPAALSGVAKGVVVFALVLATSWGASAALRRVPGVADIV
jgi:hypothetical protein